jgi:CPA2 family monovalent cation:H+ antiporter-2
MHHGPDPMLATVVACILLAFLFGAGARMLRLPALIGFIAAGIVVSPYTPGFVAEHGLVFAMAEVGVALLLFGVGLHFRPADLLEVWRVAVPGALAQIVVCTGVGAALGMALLELRPGAAAAFGLALAISSTAVATRALQERGRMGGQAGRIALGWLVMQDLVVVFALVLLPAIAGARGAEQAVLPALAKAAFALLAFGALMALFGARALPWLLVRVARTGSREIFTLAVLAIALGVAFLASALFGVSFALGAFFAGVLLGESDVGHQAAAESTPLRHIFAAIFFVSVGMLIDPAAVAAQPLAAAAALLAVPLAIGGFTLAALLALRVAPREACTVAGALAQIGEFSFLLVELAVREELLPASVRGPVLVAAAGSIVLTPLSLRAAEALAPRLERSARLSLWRGERRPALSTRRKAEALSGHAIVIGGGRVGALVMQALHRHGLPVLGIEADRGVAERLAASGLPVIWGDAARPEVFGAAAPERACVLVVALPGALEARAVLHMAHAANPALRALVRTHSEEEAAWLEAEEGVGLVLMGEREVALGMADSALRSLGVPVEAAQRMVEAMRKPG